MPTDLCPWLGTAEDKEIRHAEASEAHVCHARARPVEVELEYQAQFCLGSEHRTCAFYREPEIASAPELPTAEADEVGLRRKAPRWLLIGLWLITIVLVGVALYLYLPSLLARQSPTPTPSVVVSAQEATAAPLPSAFPSQPERAAPTSIVIPEATATPSPYPGGAIFRLAPEARAAGWVASDEASGNHLGDSYLYSGVYDGVIYHGFVQFDLSALAAGATIHAGTLELTGLDRLRVVDGGAWEVRLLAGSEEEWTEADYQAIHAAPAEWTLSPALSSADLVVGQANLFALPDQVLRGMEAAVADGRRTLSVRLDGPLAGSNNVFAWDSGYGPATLGNAPQLMLSVGPAPDQPTATSTPRYIVVTSTATPGNVLTAAADLLTATASAQGAGRPEDGPVVYWTATPVIVVTSLPTPANQATAEYRQALATAVAMTTGTYTPTPINVVTATPTAGTPMPPSATLPPTQAPTPAATRLWTATPAPPAQTATATPTGVRGPTVTPLPTAPSELQGKILFFSDRNAASPWAMNADGTGLSRLSDGTAYESALGSEALSPDGASRTYVAQIDGMPALFVGPAAGGQGTPLVAFQDAELEWPVWAPAGNLIAFVARSQGGAEIWLIRSSGDGLRQLTAEAWGQADHPTFCPDGQCLAYASADGSGRRQIWTILVDGSGRHRLSDGAYDDWDPVWVK